MEEGIFKNEEELPASQRVHWNAENPTKLDLEYHDRIGFIQKGVLYGAVLTLGLSVLLLFISANGDNGVLALVEVIPSLILGYLGIQGGLGIEKRKPNSVFLCKVYAWMCTVWNFIVIVVSFATGGIPGIFVIIWFVYGICVLIALYSSDDINMVFPKEYRKITTSDLVLTMICVGIDVIMILLIIVGLFAHVSA